jgi:hypothetical protein
MAVMDKCLAQNNKSRIEAEATKKRRSRESIVQEYSLERITSDDLHRLATLAFDYFDDLFKRRPNVSGRFRGRLLMLALCQGAALHYVDGLHGVKDFDVWGFFRALPDVSFPCRLHGRRDFGRSRFGRHPDTDRFEGRRVDILGRSIDDGPEEDAIGAVRRWLASGPHGSSAWHLAKRPVIAIYPEPIFGRRIWLPGNQCRNEITADSTHVQVT